MATKKKGKGFESGAAPLVKDHPNKEVIKQFLNLSDDDPIPGDVKQSLHIASIKFELDVEGNTLPMQSMTVELKAYAITRDAGAVKRIDPIELPDEYKSITWGPEVTPAVPPEDILDDADPPNIIQAKGAIRSEIPALADLLDDPQKAGLLDTVRTAFLVGELRALIPSLAGGAEVEL